MHIFPKFYYFSLHKLYTLHNLLWSEPYIHPQFCCLIKTFQLFLTQTFNYSVHCSLMTTLLGATVHAYSTLLPFNWPPYNNLIFRLSKHHLLSLLCLIILAWDVELNPEPLQINSTQIVLESHLELDFSIPHIPPIPLPMFDFQEHYLTTRTTNN